MAPFGAAGADQGVQLVDEQDGVLGPAHLVHDGLDAFLELAAILGAGDHHGQVEDDDAAIAQQLGDVAVDDELGQALDDGGLADAGLAEQHRVVLGAAAEDLDDAFDLVCRPMTGSSLPWRASSVRSRPKLSRAGVLDLPLFVCRSPPLPPPLSSVAILCPSKFRTSSRTSSSFSPRFMRTWAATPSCSRSRPSSRCSVPT